MANQASQKKNLVTASSQSIDPITATSDLLNSLSGVELNGLLFFCSSKFNLDDLGKEINSKFTCPVFGCTTSGQIYQGSFLEDTLVVVGFTGDTEIVVEKISLDHIDESLANLESTKDSLIESKSNGNLAALLLVDGLSMQEELVAHKVSEVLESIPLIGGSAGDDLEFVSTFVFINGEFLRNHAVVAFLKTQKTLVPFRFNHFVPTESLLVVTNAVPAQRRVIEINGIPAAEAYASAINVPLSELKDADWSCNPILVNIAGSHFVRSVQCVNDDGSLTLYCAIEEGVVLNIGTSIDVEEAAKSAFDTVLKTSGEIDAIIGFDCILRKLEFQSKGIDPALGKIYSDYKVIGFSTYGEQYNGVHQNQTFTGLAIAA